MRIFVDTNILIYSIDSRDAIKQAKAQRALASREQFVWSTQVQQEFFVTAANKLGYPLASARLLLDALSWLDTVTVTPAVIREAIGVQINSRISFWDALIVAAASEGGCELLWTEDLNAGQLIGGVRIENPLH